MLFHTSVYTLAITLNNIELSSQFECLPNGDPIPGFPRRKLSDSFKLYTPVSNSDSTDPPVRVRTRSPPARYNFASSLPAKFHPASSPSARSPPASFPPGRSSRGSFFPGRSLPVRFITPPARLPPMELPSSDGSPCGLDQLPLIRISSYKNPHRIFGLRRYTFPSNKLLDLKVGHNAYEPVPTQEQIVISTSSGDIFAILETSDILSGLYLFVKRNRRRVKINMGSGIVTQLTTNEIEETPVGSNRRIAGHYRVKHSNDRVNNSLLYY